VVQGRLDVASDLTGMMAARFPGQDRSARDDLIRALTVLQVGIEIVPGVLPPDRPAGEASALIRLLTAATDLATEAIGALVEAGGRTPAATSAPESTGPAGT
jgi:hypothetical protein